ncbi:MAG: amino acid carrier protein [Waddliaceae bacterium]
MTNTFFFFLGSFDDFLWGYLGVPIIILLGIFLTIRSNFFQIRKFPIIVRTFFHYFTTREKSGKGIHPLKAFFACIGGCVGVSNIVGVCTAIQIGGPGALFWIWLTAMLGMIMKYAEVYLGIRYRVVNKDGGCNGGPMYYLQQITSKKWVPALFCILMCVYGVEVYQFSVITESVSSNFSLHRGVVGATLLFLVFFAGSGGVRRVGNISSALIPTFIFLYMGMGMWVLIQNFSAVPGVLRQVFSTAFTGSSAFGGFVGSSLILTVSQGVRRGCYTTDVGVGYASIIHSESTIESAERQASLVIVDIFLDTFIICTMSVCLILVTGIWNEPLEAAMLVQTIFSEYFPFMDFFMPLFLFLLGYSTITAYFLVGAKCAEFVSPTRGRFYFYLYSITALALSAFVDTSQSQTVMAIAGGLLLIINCWGIYRLHKEVSYSLGKEYPWLLATDCQAGP